ncbi:MAG: Helix-turn-helix domain, partial [Acidimicrobiia bacterium]|nr:Helix-turn-helix domain [Acidimicrobiia bacterium]
MEPVPVWLSASDAASFLGVDSITIRRMMMRGELPAHLVDGSIQFRASDLLLHVVASGVSNAKGRNPAGS